jgi:hypothetical protein
MFLLLWTRSVTESDVANGNLILPDYISKYILDYRLTIGILMASIVWIVPKPQNVLSPNKYAKKVRQKILRQINRDIFDGNSSSKRITIFTESAPIRNFIYHAGMYAKFVLFRLSWGESPRYGQFLVIRNRVGQDKRAKWSTAFYHDFVEEKKCEGIASQALHSGDVIAIDELPDLRDIDLSSISQSDIEDEAIDTEEEPEAIQDVRDYMDSCGISDIETLRQISVPARHIWAAPLYNRTGEQIGALVIDSTEDESFLPENEDLMGRVEPYIKSLVPTYLEGHYA